MARINMDKILIEEFNRLNHVFNVGVEFEALAGNLVNPHNFYMIPTYYKTFIEKYLLPGKQYKEEELKPDKIVAFRSSKTKSYLRGHIKYVSATKLCSVVAVDFGHTELNVDCKRIFYPTHEALENIPPLALHCELDKCLPILSEFSTEAVQAFFYLVGYDEVRVGVRGQHGDKLVVCVTNSAAPDDVASLLTITQLTSAEIPVQTYRTSYEWSYKKLQVGQTLEVILQYASANNNFYVITPDDYKEYLRDMYHFSTYCRALPYLYSINENLIGKAVGVMEFLNGPYERAVVTEIPPDGNLLKVKLIDWGREFVTDMTKVRLVTSSFLASIPARALYCSDPVMSAGHRRHSMRIGDALKIQVKEVGEKFNKPSIVYCLSTNVCNSE